MVLVKNFNDLFIYIDKSFHKNKIENCRDVMLMTILDKFPEWSNFNITFKIIHFSDEYIKDSIVRFKIDSDKYQYHGKMYTKKELISLFRTFPYKLMLIANGK